MKSTLFKVAAIASVALAASGCAHHTMYEWGGYDDMLYKSYKQPETVSDFRVELEQHVTELEKSHQPVAPGLYAEVGTLYLQAGDAANATTYYRKERDAWPESRGLMDALIQHASERKPTDKPADKPVDKAAGEAKS